MDGSKGISQTAWLYSQIILFPFLPSQITKSQAGFSEVALIYWKVSEKEQMHIAEFSPFEQSDPAKEHHKHPLTLLLPNKQDLIKQTMSYVLSDPLLLHQKWR